MSRQPFEGNIDLSQPADEVRVARVLKASPARVWRVLASADGMQQWMGMQLFQAQLGGRLLLDTNAAGPDDRIIIWGRVTELLEAQRLGMTWRVMREDGSAWPLDTLLCIELEPVAEGCRVTLVHSGFAALGDGAEKSYQVYHHCWVETPCLRRLDEQSGERGPALGEARD